MPPLARRCTELRSRIQQITDGEYAIAKRDVDALRGELGQPPLPSLQATLEEKSAQYVPSLLLRLPPTPSSRVSPNITRFFRLTCLEER